MQLCYRWFAQRCFSSAVCNISDMKTTTKGDRGCCRNRKSRSCSTSPPENVPRRRSLTPKGSITSRRRRDADAEFYEYSTLHGVSDIYRSRNWCMRLLWFNVFFGAVIAAFYGCGGIIAEYLEKPVVVSYFVQEPENNTLDLPDIVVCPFNRFNRSFLEQLNISDGLAQYLELSFPSPAIFNFQDERQRDVLRQLDRYDAELAFVLEALGNMTFKDFLERASIHCSAFILEPKNCSQMETVMTSAGKCIRVPGVTQTGAGFGYGRRVVVRLPHSLFNPGINQLLNDGIAVKLTERGKGPSHDLLFVPSGSHAILPLKATRYQFMNDAPRYKCDENLPPHYSRQNCFDTCLVEEAELTCQCRLVPSKGTHPSLPACTATLIYSCFFAPEFYKAGGIRETKCRMRCRPPCAYWEYTGSMSYAKFPAPETRAFISNESEWRKLEQTIILNVFFEQLEYTLIKHVVAMTPLSFIAQLGGQISLWVGGSIMTIFQVIIYCAQLFCRQCRQLKSHCRCASSSARPNDTDEQPQKDVVGASSAQGVPPHTYRNNVDGSIGNGNIPVFPATADGFSPPSRQSMSSAPGTYAVLSPQFARLCGAVPCNGGEPAATALDDAIITRCESV